MSEKAKNKEIQKMSEGQTSKKSKVGGIEGS